MKWFKRTAITVVVLLLLLAAAAWWVLGTRAGLDFALARASALSDGALHVGQARGRLVGPLDLTDIRYDDGKGTRIGIDRMHLELRSWPLLSRRAHVRELQLDGVAVSLPQNPPPRTSPMQFSLDPSVQLWVDHAQARDIHVTRGKDVLFAADRVDLRGKWTSAGLELKQLDVRAAEGFVSVDGTLAQDAGYHADTHASFAWKVGSTWYAGALVARSDGAHAQLAINLSRPMAAALQVRVAQTGDHAWSATLDAPRFDPQPLLGTGVLEHLGIAVRGTGDRHHASLSGRVDLNDYAVLLQPLRARFDDDIKQVAIEQLVLASPQIKGQLDASGTVNFAGATPNGKLAVQWQGVQLPEALSGQTLDSHGKLTLEGSVQRYHAQGEVGIGPPGKLAALTLNLDGSPQRIDVHTLALKQATGELHASGVLSLQPVLAWQAQASATRFDPGQLFAGWTGALDFDVESAGSLPAGGPDVTLALHKLSGRLRARNVSGSGKLHLTPDEVLDGKLELASGRSTLRISGTPGRSNDISADLAVVSLGDWLPAASGRLDGQFNVRGKSPALSVNGQMRGAALAWHGQRVEALSLVVGIPDTSKIAGKIDLHATGVHTQGLTFNQLTALAEGSQRNHQLTVVAHGKQLSATLRLRGAMGDNANWDGTLSTLDLAPQGLPPWRLLQPSRLRYAGGAMSLTELCLTAGDPQLCIAANQ
ncbi:MAG: pathogenicity protein, partial [Rhodanobacter sp.]